MLDLRPTDGNEVPDQALKDLENPPAPQVPPSREAAKTPENQEENGEPLKPDAPLQDKKTEEGEEDKVPFHADPKVQSYIERQVAKRVADTLRSGDSAGKINERLDRIEKGLLSKAPDGRSDWKPQTPQEKDAVRAIISEAKREMIADLKAADEAHQEDIARSDQLLQEWMDELEVTGKVKTDEDKQEVIRLLAEYGKGRSDDEDKALILKLYETLKAKRDEGAEEGEEEGKKKAQEAKIGTSRTSRTPGQQEKTYQQRKLTEGNFSDILERELNRLENRN